MADSLTDAEKRVVSALAGGLAPVSRPYLAAAEAAACSEEQLLAALRALVKKGIVRKVAAVLDSKAMGLAGGALVAWRVPEAEIERAGKALAADARVTHCYARATAPEWPYNLYTMVHAEDEAAAREWALDASERVEVGGYVVLLTEEELKKTPPKYSFEEPGEEDVP